jgi:hypothetical protein
MTCRKIQIKYQTLKKSREQEKIEQEENNPGFIDQVFVNLYNRNLIEIKKPESRC